MKKKIGLVFFSIVDIMLLPVLFLCLLSTVLFVFGSKKNQSPRLLWGAVPIKSLTLISDAMKQVGYQSDIIVSGSSTIYPDSFFDYVLLKKTDKTDTFSVLCNHFIARIKSYLFFFKALTKYDIFHYYFDGGILQKTIYKRIEFWVLKICGKKIILMPYGSDAFVYDHISNLMVRHVLIAQYPMHGNSRNKIHRQVISFTKAADIVVGCLVHVMNLPRWDILPLIYYPINTQEIKPSYPRLTGPVIIAHASNHRIIKGTEFLCHAVNKLKQEGYNIILDVIEKVSNEEAMIRISKADIYVDQLVFGFALAALEAMALGKIVITALKNTDSYDLFRHYSYLNECRAISANVETIYDVLKNLLDNRERWVEIGEGTRQYCEKRHSFKACSEMFQAIYDKIWYNKKVDLINYYAPNKEYLQ